MGKMAVKLDTERNEKSQWTNCAIQQHWAGKRDRRVTPRQEKRRFAAATFVGRGCFDWCLEVAMLLGTLAKQVADNTANGQMRDE